jgi:hypothetical protein
MIDLFKHVLRAGFPVWDICNSRGSVEEDFCQGAKKAWSIYLYIRKATYVVGADGESSAGASYKTRIAERGERDLGPHAGSRNFVISHRCSGERACVQIQTGTLDEQKGKYRKAEAVGRQR